MTTWNKILGWMRTESARISGTLTTIVIVSPIVGRSIAASATAVEVLLLLGTMRDWTLRWRGHCDHCRHNQLMQIQRNLHCTNSSQIVEILVRSIKFLCHSKCFCFNAAVADPNAQDDIALFSVSHLDAACSAAKSLMASLIGPNGMAPRYYHFAY